MLTYAPGFEVEARVIHEPAGPHLTWIGFASRQEGDALPTISGQQLETLRIGSAAPISAEAAKLLDAEIQARANPGASYTTSWLKACIDEQGLVTSAVPYETMSTQAETLFAAAVMQWRFRPFVIAGQPIPVCAMVRLSHPAGAAPSPEQLPMPPPPSRHKQRPPIMFAQSVGVKLLEGRRIAGERNIVPNDLTRHAMQSAGLSRITATLRVCLDESGGVESVLPMRSSGFAAYDQRLLAAMRAWRYSPYQIDGVPVAVCTVVTFIYSQRGNDVRTMRN